MASDQEDGPKLATIFVLRLLSSSSGGLFASSTLKSSKICAASRSFTVSASKTAEASALTDSTGYFPLAASPLSITASVPSHTAFCKSLTSARVGTGCSIMLSTICVAVITKRPSSFAFLISNFCAKGTRSNPNSTPKSPRATISAWDSSMIPSMFVNAWGFSILGQIFGRRSRGTLSRSMISTNSCKSCFFWAKETQMYSQGGSNFSKYSASSTSFSVKAAQSISQSGTFTPFLAFSLPPRTTFTFSSWSLSFWTTATFMRPSSMRRSTPGTQALIRAFCSMVGFIVIRPGFMLSLSSLERPNSKISPSIRGTGSPSSSPTLNLGPCRSPKTSTFLPSSSANLRISGYTRSKSPPRRCEQFKRNMSVPARIISFSFSSLHEAGPKLATTFVLRRRSSVSCFFNAMEQ
mmetsp:Transcript_32171/g.86160  ORF Transcript_32171/g.86160 Transcript_32171/m.86160 type:complete len:408 (+) Transcript_32171:1330-2553(+)